MFTRSLKLAPAMLLMLIGTSRGDESRIVIKDFMFMPMAMSVPVGSTVTWDNEDGEPHTVVSLDGAFRSQALDEKDHFSHQFNQAGTFKYICSIHPKMVGTITVTAK